MGTVFIYIISFIIQSNVIVCGNSNVFHVDPNCEGLSNCKSKLSYVSITSLTKSNRLCGYENEKVLVCGNSSVFHKDENTRSSKYTLVNQINHLCDVVHNKVKPKINGDDGLISFKIIDAILKSSKSGKKVKI